MEGYAVKVRDDSVPPREYTFQLYENQLDILLRKQPTVVELLVSPIRSTTILKLISHYLSAIEIPQ